MSLQRIIAVLGSAVLVTTLVAESPASAEQHRQPRQQQPQQPQRQPVVNPLDTTIHFGFDSADLDAEARRHLDEVARWLQDNPQRVVVVAGHTDQTGPDDYNLVLGKERARQTKQYLVNRGIDPDRIITVSFGAEFPVSDEPAENRRTVFYATRLQDGVRPPQPEMRGTTPDDTAPDTFYDREDDQRTLAPDRDPWGADNANRNADVLGMEPVEDAPPVLFGRRGKATDDLLTRYGLSVSAGGGATGFVAGDTRTYTSPGTGWDVRLMAGTRMPVAVELAYFRARMGIQDLAALAANAGLRGSGVEGALRVNILSQRRFQPYVLTGVGWTRYSLVDTPFEAASINTDRESVVHVPVAAGLGFRITRSLLADVRGTVRPAFGSDLQFRPQAQQTVAANLTSWSIGARLGWEF